MMRDPSNNESLFEGEDAFEESHVRARTMPAPPLEEHERTDRHRRNQLVLQGIGVLVIGTAIYVCFGTWISRAIGLLFVLRHNSWLRESLICGSLVILPLVPVIWRYMRHKTQTPRS